MTATDLIQIKNTVVDANNYVLMQGVEFSAAYKKRINSYPLDGQFSGTNYQISKGDRTGIENPQFEIRGVINLRDFTTNLMLWNTAPSTAVHNAEDGTSMTGMVTLGYLLSIWKNMTGQSYLKITTIIDGYTYNWYDTTITTTDIPIEVENFTFKPRTDSDGLHLIDYVLTCREVRV